MIRSCFALLLAFVILSSPCFAVEIYWSTSELPKELGEVNVRDLQTGRLLIAADESPLLESDGLTRVEIPAGTTPFLVRLHDAKHELELLAGKVSLLESLDGEFVILAATDAQARELDALGLHRERITYIAPSRAPWRAPGEMALAKVDAQTKSDIVGTVSEAKIAQYMRELSGNLVFWLDGVLRSTNNRYTHNAGHLIAADYLQDRLETLGYSVTRQYFTVGSTTTQNIIAERIGTLYPDEIVVVGGHYDSTSENPNSSAPGCEDNASGTAGVLHLAEIFSGYDVERTIHFIAFGGEEQGLYGSEHYVQQASLNGDNITESLIMDMVASWQTNFRVIIEGDEPWQSLMELYEDNVLDWSGIGYRKDWNSWGSDHVPFQQAGIPCFLAIDWDYGAYPEYHRTGDVFSETDPALAQAIVRAMAGTLSDLTNPSPKATPVEPLPDAQRSVRLVGNHPNPFNPATTIAFELNMDSRVRMDVFDAAGRHIRSLVNADYTAGRHELRWMGQDEAGQSVASGVYICRLQSGDTVLSQRMVLAK